MSALTLHGPNALLAVALGHRGDAGVILTVVLWTEEARELWVRTNRRSRA
ncbi:hypothetical protein [Sphaerotilus sp.]|nr:hypothetical protein [Sphaerotilus sp.]MDZ7857726.1 hypothetical protein [Sphaerotilus sp.]